MNPKKQSTKSAEGFVGSESLEEAPQKQERPPVRQVVEVVEEETTQPQASAKPPASESVEPPASTSPHDEEKEEKRKELVDELFEKSGSTLPPVTPEISMHRKSPVGQIILWAIVIIAVCVGIGAGILIFSGNGPSLPSIVALSTPTPTPTVPHTPTPTSTALDRAAITIQVLNGGGKAGAAGTMKTLLEEKGYTVSDTGNAESFTYEDTEILVKPEKVAYLTQFQKDIETTYTIGTAAATLADDAPYDARITVGKE